MHLDIRPMVAALGALFFIAMPAMAGEPIELPTPQAQAELLDMLEREALYRDRVEWPAIRARLKTAQGDPGRTRDVRREAIDRSSGGHGRWISSQRLQSEARRLGRSNAAVATAPEAPVPVDLLDRRIGWMGIEGYSAAPGPAAREQMKARAARWQAIIGDKDNGNRCGWIVDLRDNTGGNMWPMLLGVAPLLRTSAMGIEDVGSFETADGPVRWQTTASGVRMGEATRLDFGQPGYLPSLVGAPVAVLTGPRTASSGEATVLAFRGRAQTRSFGQPTAGVSTANVVRRLVDGSALVLTTSVMRDRNGDGDGRKIAPDQATVGDAATVAAAEAWLLAQPACQGS
ncbi:S41 family peptidase [Stenotrophomonas sp. YIM B13575]|uniref:S41 family peptidase n=1 Tax=Stenotrophomonas sp. YIM B13575 TaxID=3366314 RepID=UPI0036CC91A2